MLKTKSVTVSLGFVGDHDIMSTENVSVTLVKPITAPVLVPVLHASTPTCINDPFMVDGECYKVTAMSFGTPHGAVFVDDLDNTDVASIGPSLGMHALFPQGASIVFIQSIDKETIKARLWQRGEGEIPFTAEAACVAGTAAMMCQKVLFSETNVVMDDITFHMKWDRAREGVTLTGPANMIYGQLD